MSYLVYCIAEKPAPVPERIEGVADRPVTVVENAGVAAVVSALPQGETNRRLDELVRYARVVEAFNRQHTVIPMRFGCVLPTTGAIVELLEREARHYRQTLAELDDCVEMGVRILPRSAPGTSRKRKLGLRVPDETRQPGTSYLMWRRAEFMVREGGLQDCRRTADALRARLSGLFKESRVETGWLGPQGVLSVFFLVTRNASRQFHEAASRFCAAQRNAVLITGPWPPYNFVGRVLHGSATS